MNNTGFLRGYNNKEAFLRPLAKGIGTYLTQGAKGFKGTGGAGFGAGQRGSRVGQGLSIGADTAATGAGAAYGISTGEGTEEKALKGLLYGSLASPAFHRTALRTVGKSADPASTAAKVYGVPIGAKLGVMPALDTMKNIRDTSENVNKVTNEAQAVAKDVAKNIEGTTDAAHRTAEQSGELIKVLQNMSDTIGGAAEEMPKSMATVGREMRRGISEGTRGVNDLTGNLNSLLNQGRDFVQSPQGQQAIAATLVGALGLYGIKQLINRMGGRRSVRYYYE